MNLQFGTGKTGMVDYPKGEARSCAPVTCSDAPDLTHPKSEGWWCPTCKVVLAWHQVTYEETHDSRYGGCGEPVQPNEKGQP